MTIFYLIIFQNLIFDYSARLSRSVSNKGFNLSKISFFNKVLFPLPGNVEPRGIFLSNFRRGEWLNDALTLPPN